MGKVNSQTEAYIELLETEQKAIGIDNVGASAIPLNTLICAVKYLLEKERDRESACLDGPKCTTKGEKP
jgi:hypothetical protein